MSLRHPQLGQLARGVIESFAFLQSVAGLRPWAPRSVVAALHRWAEPLAGTAPPTTGRDLLLFAVRNRRWVEWAVFSACCLAKLGHRPTVAFSKREIEVIYGPWWDWGLRRGFWGEAQRRLPVRFVDMDPWLVAPAGETAEDAAFADRAAHVSAAYDLKLEEHDGSAEYEAAVVGWRGVLSRHVAATRRLIQELRPARVICPSGLLGATSAVLEAAIRCGVEAVFVEGWDLRPGHNIWSVNQPALHFDIPRWKAAVGGWDPQKEREFEAYLRFRQGEAVPESPWPRTFHQVQRSGKGQPLPAPLAAFLGRPGWRLLMGTNVVGDSATLGRATIFPNQRAWIEAVVDFFRVRQDLNLVIRAHPDEAWKNSRLRMGAVAESASNGLPNVFVVHGSDAVNTAALMDWAQVGLAWVSNFGLEMAFRGRPVVLGAAAQYAYTGACYSPQSKEEYFGWVARPEKLKPATHGAILEGKLYQYIVFNRISLLADSPDYQSFRYQLDEDAESDRARFYRILAGDLTAVGLRKRDESQ